MKSKAICGALLVFLGGCAGSNLKEHSIYEKLSTEAEEVASGARNAKGADLVNTLHRLVALDVFAFEAVADLAADPNPRLRSNAMYVLGYIDDRDYPDIQRRANRILRSGLNDNNDLVRYEAAGALLLRNEWEAIPVLFEGMEHHDPGVRRTCRDVLREGTSENFGFLAGGSELERTQAVARWRQWYERREGRSSG